MHTGGFTIGNNGVHVILEAGAILYTMDSSDDHTLTITGDDVTIEGGEFDGNRANNTASNYYGVMGTGDRLTVKGGYYHGYHYGVRQEAGDNCTFKHNRFTDCRDTGLMCQAYSADIYGCKVLYNEFDFSDMAVGVHLYGGYGVRGDAAQVYTMYYPLIMGNRCIMKQDATATQPCLDQHGNTVGARVIGNYHEGWGIGVTQHGGPGGIVANNQFVGQADIGIEVTDAATHDGVIYDVTVTGNVVRGDVVNPENCYQSATNVGSTAFGRFTISGNVFIDGKVSCAYIKAGKGGDGYFIFSNNYCQAATGATVVVRILETDNVVVSNNILDGNGLANMYPVRIDSCEDITVTGNQILNSVRPFIVTDAEVNGFVIDRLNITNNQIISYSAGGSPLAQSWTGGSLGDDICIKDNVGVDIIALANDATPSVVDGTLFLTGGTTTITDFDDGYEGKVITVIAEHSLTITDGTNIFLSGSANWAMTATDTLTLIQKADGKWYETARSDSGA
jgi:hypothetical protein